MDQATRRPGDDSSREELVRVMHAVAAQDAAALRALYRRTSAKMYGIVLGLVHDEADAQDVLQDVYVTVWRKASLYDPAKASVITWLATLSRNKAIDRLRRRSAPIEDIEAAEEIADETPSSLAVLEQAEDAVRLRDCLEQLEERARRMIRSAFFDGYSYAELAEASGVPLGTMKSWIRRGLLRLRGCLEQ